MTVEVGLEPTTWKLVPTSTAEEIAQCVKCLLLTSAGTVFFYREFGISTELIDRPINVAKNRFLAEVVKQVAKYEPRAKVKSIRWTGDGPDGILKPTVILEVQT